MNEGTSEMSGEDHEAILRRLGSRTAGSKILKTTEAVVEAESKNEEIRLNETSSERPIGKQRSIPAFLRGPTLATGTA